MPDREQAIRERAYEIWESEGQPQGRDGDHWEQASRDIGEAVDEARLEPQPPMEPGPLKAQPAPPRKPGATKAGAAAKAKAAPGAAAKRKPKER